MLAERRRRLILDSLHAAGAVSVADLAPVLGTSTATIRRDLAHLESQRLLRRVHGGALPLPEVEVDAPFDAVRHQSAAHKRAIAARCAEIVQDGETVILDIGTTVYEIAHALRGRRLTVLTTSLAVVEVLADEPRIEVVVLGGVVRPRYRSLVGGLVEDALRGMSADRLFLGASGIDVHGQVVDTTMIEVPVKRAMLAAGRHRVLVADGSKTPGRGAGKVCRADRVDTWVTTSGVDMDTVRTVRDLGVNVEVLHLTTR